jgi:phosphoribosyl-ATP pyrophosphohydrolase
MAQKLAEEATEVVIEPVRGERLAVIRESVDLLYNLVVLWSELGITSRRSGAKWIAARRSLGWRRSCRRKSG